MAEIKPFLAWRYNPELSQNIGALICPPFDVVSENQKQALYQNPLNSIHLSVPRNETQPTQVNLLLEHWKQNGIILQDKIPGLYVYYQYFNLPGQEKTRVRKGFICMIKAYYWNEGIVFRHEDTMPYSVNDRLDLLAATQLNVSPTHGLYTDTDFTLDTYMDESMENPVYETEDYQGVRDVLSVITDPAVIRVFIETLKFSKVILADGHHRYESSLAYRKQKSDENPNHTGKEMYNYHLMYLTNTESNDFQILPTHRLINGHPTHQMAQLLEEANKYFYIKEVENAHDIPDLIIGKKWTFGWLTPVKSYVIKLKNEIADQLEADFSKEIVHTDLIVLHLVFIQNVLRIPFDSQKNSKDIDYEKSFANCLYKMAKNEVEMVLITNGVTIEQVKNICFNGYLLPQKSTFFYPKAICGFVFGSISNTEQ